MLKSNNLKNTAYGMIPIDWEIAEIADCVKIETGTKNTEDKISDGKYPFYVRSQTVEKINSYSYDTEAVITAGDGVGTGKIFHYINGKFNAHQRVYVMTNFDKVLGRYFYYYFSNNFYNEVTKYTAKSSVDSVRRDMIAKMLIPIPSEKEQKAIAEALSDVDNLIISLEKLIEKNKAIKQGTMQDLLTGKKRIKGYERNWININLSEHSKIKARIGWQGLTTEEYLDQGYAYLITGTDFLNGRIDWDNCHFVNEERFVQDKNIQIVNGDILVTKDGTIGKVGYVMNLNSYATLNSGVFVIRAKSIETYNTGFVYYILKSSIFTDFLNKLSAGSTINHLYQKDFVNFTFDIPQDIKEQKAIAEILFDIDSEITALESKLLKYRQIKQGMMQELLTGRIRLM